ncbi:MAG: hypothetical protein OK454_10705, partial [Thaumarchaeota archaeon]|nr:hypothetical protein [Nitrososphaerota archaeon]
MASHFSSLGFNPKDSEAFLELARETVRKGEKINSPAGIYSWWSVGSGVELWTLTDPSKGKNAI